MPCRCHSQTSSPISAPFGLLTKLHDLQHGPSPSSSSYSPWLRLLPFADHDTRTFWPQPKWRPVEEFFKSMSLKGLFQRSMTYCDISGIQHCHGFHTFLLFFIFKGDSKLNSDLVHSSKIAISSQSNTKAMHLRLPTYCSSAEVVLRENCGIVGTETY